MTPGEISSEKLWDIIKRCELTADEERQVQQHCARSGVMYLSTPFSREAADRLDAWVCRRSRSARASATTIRCSTTSRAMRQADDPVDRDERHRLGQEVGRGDPQARRAACAAALHQHVSDAVRKGHGSGRSSDLAGRFPGMPVGLSDHSMNIWTCLGAVALGASILEKHFTISRAWPGPDTGISIEPDELKDLIEGTRAVWQRAGRQQGHSAGGAAGDRFRLCDRRVDRAGQGRSRNSAGTTSG